MLNDFERPSRSLLWLSQVGGVVTAIAMIFSLRSWIATTQPKSPEIVVLSPTEISKLDAASINPANPATAIDLTPLPIEFSPMDQAIGQKAWRYFQQNWNAKTGFVNAVTDKESITMSDTAITLAAIVSAKELNIIEDKEFTEKMSLLLKTLAKLPLYKDQLPNKFYNAKTGDMTGSDQSNTVQSNTQSNTVQESGWSALDLGRLARWLKIVGDRYPQFRSQTQTIWQSWQVESLTQKGQIYQENLVQGEEQYKPQGRLGSEAYAAYGFKLWGVSVDQSLNVNAHRSWVQIYGQKVPVDSRPALDANANEGTIDSYFLDGIESGFQALPKSDADRILSAQIARYQATHQLTAVAQDRLDRSPGVLNNTLYANQQPWASVANQQNYPDFRGLSTKASIAWDVLYHTNYTQSLVSFVKANLESDRGWYSGYYEVLKQPNQALTAETNGVILESLLYRKVKKPLLQWAKTGDR